MNWKTKTIEELQQRMAMTETEAQSYYNRVYRMALKEIGGKQKGLKISREIYGSLFYQGEQVFHIDNAGTKVEINPIMTGTSDVETALRLSRMEAFFDKYGDSKTLQAIKEEYISGKIDKKEFNFQIKMFKKYSVKYLKSGS